MTDDDKVRENRLRRMAQRQGLRLVKARRRDPRAVDYGRYWLVNDQLSQARIYGGEYGVDLDSIEERLTNPRQSTG